MLINNVYTSIACNRTPKSLDWGKNNLICYAACNAVAIFNPNYNNSSKIIQTLIGHKARVNTVQWIKSNDINDPKETELISGSNDNTAIIWNIKNEKEPTKYILQGHTNGVTFVSAIYLNNVLTVATTSIDSTIKLWHKIGEEFVCFQTIDLKSGLCFALKLFVVPQINVLLFAYATDDDKVHLCFESNSKESDRQFLKLESLLGHEDWVREIDIITDNDDILIATSSQDTFIRLWRLSPRKDNSTAVQKEVNLEEDIQIEERIVTINSSSGTEAYYALSLESVLQGHDGWVYSISWFRNASTNNLQLLSASIDKSLIIWEPAEMGVWFEKVRVGEVGGNSLGFYGGKFSPNGKSIIGHAFTGSLHLWHNSETSWNPGVIIGGHYADVRDIAWERNGEFLYSVSADQTTRIHAPWKRSTGEEITWHEIARPQVHGYDMQCICVLSKYQFASGAEEKIVRTFQAPANFVENFRKLCSIAQNDKDQEGDAILQISQPKGASVPSLGLSNKAVFCSNEEEERQADRHAKDNYPENYFTAVSLEEPPTEETLMQNTLWVEIQKLYGHGYEIYTIAANPDGKLLATCCKASTAEHAKVFIWNTSTWKIIQKLESHQLTVTQMRFSPNGKQLVTVSRDRRWSLFENKSEDPKATNFELVATTDKKNGIHSRIIWCCDWSHDSQLFATGSRDGKVVIWQQTGNNSNSTLGYCSALDTKEFKNESVTAISFSHSLFNNENDSYLIAMGFENGSIQLFNYKKEWINLYTINQSCAHHLPVRVIHFRPDKEQLQIASCGEDHLVRIYDIVV